MAEEKPRKRRRRRRRIVITILLAPLVLIALVLALVVFLPWILTEDRLRSELVSALTESLGAPVKIGRLQYRTLSGIELFDVVVGPPKGFERDVLTAKRIAVRYAIELGRREIEVKEIAVDDPRVVLERAGGETNVDAIQRNLSRGTPAEKKKEPARPLKGALSPVTVALDLLAVRNLELETAGEGPGLSLKGVDLEANAKLDPKKAGAALVLSVRPDPKDKRRPNIVVDLPKGMIGIPLHAEIAASFTTTVAAQADTHDGLAVERAQVDASLESETEAHYGEKRAPHTELDFGVGLEARPTEDWAALERFSVRLNGATLVAAGLRVDGVFALISGFLGDAVTEALGSQFGLAKKAKEGVVKIALDRVALPLTVLAPYIEAFRPDVRTHGTIALSPISAEGTVPELLQGRPRKLQVGLVFDGVGAEVTSLPLHVFRIDGRIDARRTEAEGQSPFGVEGRLIFGRVVQKAIAIAGAELGVSLGLERLAGGLPGQVHGAVDLRLEDVRTPPARVDRARALVEVFGDEVLAGDRSETNPISVHARLEGDRIGVGSGTTAIDVEKLALDAKVGIDRLLAAARRPIEAKLGLGVQGLRMEGRGIRLRDLAIDADASSTDPRRGVPMDAKAKVALRAKEISTPEAALEDARLDLTADAPQIGERRIALFGTKPLMVPAPASVDLDLDVDLPKIGVVHRALGVFDTKLRLSTRAGANLVNGTASLGAFDLALADAVKVKATGRSKELFERRPWFESKVEVLPVDLAKLVAALPPEIKKAAPGMRAWGTMGLAVNAVGRAPHGSIDLEDPPLNADLKIEMKGVGADVPSQMLALSGFDGKVEAGLGKGRSEIGAALSLKQLTRGNEKARAEGEAIAIRMKAGLLDEVWQVAADVEAARLQSGVGAREAVQGANLSFDAIYPRRGDLEIRHLDVKVPGSGVELALKGRLARRSFGVLRPDLSIALFLDLDKLRTLVPEVGDAHGKLAASFGLKTERETLLDASGKLELEELSYKTPKLELVRATGRLPIDQKVALPPAQLREDVAAFSGLTGDDLEARLYELSGDLSALKIVLNAEDILSAPPRTADYGPLRPYYVTNGPELKIERILYGEQTFRDITFEGDWKSGIFRVDRFSAALWEGDVFGDLALQLTADRNLRLRARLTLTELNLDIPYALAKKIEPVKGSERDDYKISGTSDLQFALRQKTVDGRIDLVKLQKPSVDRLFGLLLDPKSPAQSAMSQSEQAGVVPIALHMWITRNLLSLNLDWKPIYFKVGFRSFPVDWILSIPGARFLVTPTLGAFVMDTVNNSVRGVSIGNFLEANLNDATIERAFGFMTGKVIAEEGRDNVHAAGATSKVTER